MPNVYFPFTTSFQICYKYRFTRDARKILFANAKKMFENAFKNKNGEDIELDGNFFASTSSAEVQLFKGLNEGRREDVRVAEEQGEIEDEARLRAEAKYRERRTRFNILENLESPPPSPRILHLRV